VLTAAHCAAASGETKIAELNAAKLYGLADVTEAAAQPQYTGREWPAPDLALSKLSQSLPRAPVFLTMRPVVVGERLIIVGYGIAERDDSRTVGTPRMAMLTVSPQSAAVLTLVDRLSKIGGCLGDSGAPALAMRGGVPALESHQSLRRPHIRHPPRHKW